MQQHWPGVTFISGMTEGKRFSITKEAVTAVPDNISISSTEACPGTSERTFDLDNDGSLL